MPPDDCLANVLHVDLSEKAFWVERRDDLFERYLGGSGVAVALLHEECPEGCDPLDPESPIILAVGPLTGLLPLASKTVAMFKSPHTGNLGESHCGGRSAVAMRMAGYGAIVIKGASETPVYVAVHGDRVRFRDAATLWGMGSSFTAGRIIREQEPGAGLRTIMRIGRAGEKLVSYAGVTTETYRHFGRLGLGAVFGSKRLKAVVVSGKRSLPVADRRGYRKLYDEIFQTAVDSPVMRKYHELGTAENILPLNELGGLPTRNLTASRFEAASQISGESFAEHYLGRRLACSHCPVACIHIAALREPYADEPYFYKTSMIGYDYEPIFAIGSMLGISDPAGILRLMDRVEALGLDVMSAGVVLAWATEAQQRGLISNEETDGVALAWDDCDAYLEAVGRIVEQPNEFYRCLARGVDCAAERYGGTEFALAFGGNEMPGYHTGPAAHVGFLVGARHSHLDNAGYSIDQKTLVTKRMPPEELARAVISEEAWRQVLSSLVVCFFARGIYKPEIVSQALQAAGVGLAPDDLDRVGDLIYREKYRFKFREGFSLEDVRIPKRIFETPSLVREWDEAYVRSTVEEVRKALSAATE
ncbi:MAG TPA: aldehyde ferredoxin oxidoreductase family protein [Thermoguttaceae bacterium]|nr:aldehyde ferredoxin oxidoreductase family protein [Thermoguttaceae bacterium]